MAIQYTIRNIPPTVDKALKRQSKLTRKSFNQTVVDALIASTHAEPKDTFDWLIGTMDKKDAQAFDSALAHLNKPDPDFWR